MIDREQVRDVLDHARPNEYAPEIRPLWAAARAWLDQGDALVIRRSEDGQWPEDDLHMVVQVLGLDHKTDCARIAQAFDALSDRDA